MSWSTHPHESANESVGCHRWHDKGTKTRTQPQDAGRCLQPATKAVVQQAMREKSET